MFWNKWREKFIGLQNTTQHLGIALDKQIQEREKLLEDFKTFRDDTEKIINEREKLKGKVRKQIEADLLMVSLEIIVNTLGIKDTKSIDALRDRQIGLQQALGGLRQGYNTMPQGVFGLGNVFGRL